VAFTTRARVVERASITDGLAVGVYELKQAVRKMAGEIVGPQVFLSHSHSDTDLITFAMRLLTSQGAEIYIDHKDRSLPDSPSTETADLLRDKIKWCERFVMLASDNGLESKWVPWELGYADGEKPDGTIAVLPVQENEKGWNGSEYVGLYATIQELTEEDWRVVQPGKTIYGSDTLKDWLKS